MLLALKLLEMIMKNIYRLIQQAATEAVEWSDENLICVNCETIELPCV